MNTLIRKAFKYYQTNGFKSTTTRIFEYLHNASKIKRYDRFAKNLNDRTPASVFSEIYEKNLWMSGESRSGPGSELAYTENLRRHLPIIFERIGARTIIDAPCGDFNWMRLVPLANHISYVGADIAPELIRINKEKYEDEQHGFIVANILQDPLPTSDLWICRDALIHFSYKDIVLALNNFINSNTSFLLTTTYINRDTFVNRDILTGDFRLLDLFSEPFYFPKDVLYRAEDFVPPYPPREMCLWNKTQIHAAVKELSKKFS